jgi:hypothetical protein
MLFRAFKLSTDLDVVEITSFGKEVISENWLKNRKTNKSLPCFIVKKSGCL